MAVTKEEYNEWKNHPVTKVIKQSIEEERDRLKDIISSGTVLEDFSEQKVARLIGHIEGLDYLLDIRYEDEEDVDD